MVKTNKIHFENMAHTSFACQRGMSNVFAKILIFDKISHRYTHDFRSTDRKIQNLLKSDGQNHFNQKSV